MSAIRIDPNILGGTPCFAGTRVPVDSLFVYLGRGHPLDYFLSQFPSVSREQAQAVLDMAKDDIPRLAQRESGAHGRAAG